MPDEIKELEKKIKVLEQKLTEKESIIKDQSKRGYYALNRMLFQQIEYLEGFNLKEQIGGNPKDDKIYERSKSIWEGMKDMILGCRILKQELKITPEEDEKEMKKIYRTTPESIADAIGNVAGQIQ
jgi:hypothetical protein